MSCRHPRRHLHELGQFGPLYTALHLGLPAGIASPVLQSQVIFTALIAIGWLGERPDSRQSTGFIIGFGGLVDVEPLP
jgi:O-acetylserine/cysteine efflux transporter